MKGNYHTHTTRCGHAVGQDEAYVLAALEAGFEELGFSDHAPWPFPGSYTLQIPEYVAAIRSLKERYAGRLPIRIGLESEYFPQHHDLLLRRKEAGIEYFILGQHTLEPVEGSPYVPNACHTSDDMVLRYADVVTKGIRTGLYAYVAHPDVFMGRRTSEQFTRACEEAADMICQAALEQGMPLEFNLLGLMDQMDLLERGYPSPAFWQYAGKYHNDVILGVDAHAPASLLRHDVWQEGVKRVTQMGYRLVDAPHFPE